MFESYARIPKTFENLSNTPRDSLDVFGEPWHMFVNAERQNTTTFYTGEKTMAMNKTQTARPEALRPLFKNMDPHTAQEIRESYYRIAENLRPLVNALEIADLENGGPAGPLLEEHYIFCELLEKLNQSVLGAVL